MMDISGRNILVFDIETVGDTLEDYPENIQNYLTKFADTDEKLTETSQQLAFNPLTARVAAVGMLDHRESKGCVFVNTEEPFEFSKNYKNFNYITGGEKEILQKFWETISAKRYNLFVTFNGRDFDCPFIMLRSIYLRLKPSINLMKGPEYSMRDYHIDLMREMTFNTAWGRGPKKRFSLDFYCQRFGIKSPKAEGVSGDSVAPLFKEKRFQELADYCIGDVIAESELFTFWNEFFNI